MKKRDFRSLDESTQAELRRLALADLDQGDGVYAVADRYSVHYQTIRDWRRKEKELKEREYRGEKRGRAKDEQKLIAPRKEKLLLDIIKNKTPDRVGIKATLWDRRAIQALVKKKVSVSLNLQRVSVYTKRWGLSPQRPAKYASEQSDKKIKEWLREVYPRIVARAKAEGAEIHWEDETGVALATYYARGYAPRGRTPTLSLPAKRAHISMISSITNRGDVRFMLYEKGLRAGIFTTFLERLIANRRRKIFLIVDNLKVHHAKKVTAWAKERSDSLELFFPALLRSAIQSR